MTVQEKMKAKLESLDIPYKDIKVYGSQIVVTSGSEDSAIKWASVLAKFATVRGIRESLEPTKATQHLPNKRDYIKVWRTIAVV